MHMYQIYVCEKCGFESRDQEVVELCEAKHIGLSTLEEKHTYDALKGAAKYFESVVAINNNEGTRVAYDNAINKLVDFEKKHGMV